MILIRNEYRDLPGIIQGEGCRGRDGSSTILGGTPNDRPGPLFQGDRSMFLLWQILLRVPALCVLLAGGVFAHPVQAQCCRHGGTGGPGASVLQMLMQEQLLQQQQLLLQVQQQQMLQAKVLEKQVRELAGQGPEALKSAFKAPQAEKRWAAALVSGEYEPALTEELIALLTDDNPFVRQAARQSLVRLSSRVGMREDKPGS